MQNKILFLPISIILAVVLFVTFIKPDWDVYQSKKANLEKLKKDSRELNEKYNRAKSELNEFKKVSEGVRKMIKNAVPAGVNEGEFVFELSEIISKTGVLFENVSFEQSKSIANKDKKEEDAEKENKEQSEVKSIGVSMSITGDYLSLKEFIDSLEKMNRLSTIENVNFSASESNEGQRSVKMGLSFKIYQQKEAENKKLVAEAFPSGDIWQSILKEGFDKEFVEEYGKKVSSSVDFNPDLSQAGKRNLFETQGTAQVESSETRAVADSELNQEENVENDLSDQSDNNVEADEVSQEENKQEE